MIYLTQDLAEQSMLDFLEGQPDGQALPMQDPERGLLGYVAYYLEPSGHEVQQTFQWCIRGSRPLEPHCKVVTRLADLVLPEGLFYPCDNPMSLMKGWVSYDWDGGVSEVQKIRVRDLKLDPSTPQVLPGLERAAKDSWERLVGPQNPFIRCAELVASPR